MLRRNNLKRLAISYPGKLRVLSIMPKIPEILVEFKWKSLLQFFLTGIFEITSEGGPLISVGILRPKFAIPFLTNWSVTLIRQFGRGIKSGKSNEK